MSKTLKILDILDNEFGTEYLHYLDHENDWQLLVATMLSAQCTDARVNIVTKELFKQYETLEELANADIKDIETCIYSTGFYKTKARNVLKTARMLINEYAGIVPGEMDDLIKLPGVGRKTANVVKGTIFKEPSIVVDTHVKRISKRLGFTQEEDPEKIEYELMEVLPKDRWRLYNIQIIALGRTICLAGSPKCGVCPLQEHCDYFQTNDD